MPCRRHPLALALVLTVAFLIPGCLRDTEPSYDLTRVIGCGAAYYDQPWDHTRARSALESMGWEVLEASESGLAAKKLNRTWHTDATTDTLASFETLITYEVGPYRKLDREDVDRLDVAEKAKVKDECEATIMEFDRVTGWERRR